MDRKVEYKMVSCTGTHNPPQSGTDSIEDETIMGRQKKVIL
jgi:hypothetical protein